ncbi:hypothetical protein PGQ11_008087 [Apiospora arundinis]|uniref:Uncharacterized protein n=1 Tax=Apiospora arundinis TaxID=335852 RepID=A0ABR2IER3_9PEZI
MAPFVYLNGYPGVGKLTVADELCRMLPKAKVLSNHLLIDPVTAVFDRRDKEYQPLRQTVRRTVLESIAKSPSIGDVTWIFTDQQSSSPLGSSAAMDYRHAAEKRNSVFVSVILHCELDENLRRTAGEGRGVGASNTKLTDPNIVRRIREEEDIFRFHDPNELEIDVTNRSPTEVAEVIIGHIGKASREHSDSIEVVA